MEEDTCVCAALALSVFAAQEAHSILLTYAVFVCEKETAIKADQHKHNLNTVTCRNLTTNQLS